MQPGAESLDVRGPPVDIQKLACQLSEAFGSGHVSKATAEALHQLFVGVKLFSVSVVLEGGVIVEVGSLAREGYPRLSILPPEQAAASLAVAENSWLHMVCQDSGFWFPSWARPVSFTDLAEAGELYKCKSVLFVPIPGLPPGEVEAQATSQSKEAAMGVITLGLDDNLPFDDKLLMDALILGCALSDYLPADAVTVLQRIYEIFADISELAELSARRTISQEDEATCLREPLDFDRQEIDDRRSGSEISSRRQSLTSSSTSAVRSQLRASLPTAALPAPGPAASGLPEGASPFAGLPKFDSDSESEDEIDTAIQTAVRDAVRFSFDTTTHGFGRMSRDSVQSRSAQLNEAVQQGVTQLVSAGRSVSGSLVDSAYPKPARSLQRTTSLLDSAYCKNYTAPQRTSSDRWHFSPNPNARRSASDPVVDLAPMRDLKAPILPGDSYLKSALFRSSSSTAVDLPQQPQRTSQDSTDSQAAKSEPAPRVSSTRSSPKRGTMVRRQGTPERNSYDSDIVMARHAVAGDATVPELEPQQAQQQQAAPGRTAMSSSPERVPPHSRLGRADLPAGTSSDAAPAPASLTAAAVAALTVSATPASKFRHAQMLLCPSATVDMVRLSSMDRQGLHAAAAPLQISLESAETASQCAASVAASLKSLSRGSSRNSSPLGSRASSPHRLSRTTSATQPPLPAACPAGHAARAQASRDLFAQQIAPPKQAAALTAANLVAQGASLSNAVPPPRRSSISIGARWAAYRARKAAAAAKGARESIDSFDSMASSASSSTQADPTAQSAFWLAFRNPRLEKSFRIWQTQRCMTVDAILILVACMLYLVCGYMIPGVQLGRHAPFSYPLAILAVLAPAALMWAGQYRYQRKREELMSCLSTFVSAHTAFVVVPALVALLPSQCSDHAVTDMLPCAAVRMMSALSLCATGLGSMVRFRRFLPMQVLNSSVAALSLPNLCSWAAAGQAEGLTRYLHCGLVGQTLLALVLPSALVWAVERRSRKRFLATPMAQVVLKQQ